MMPITLEAFELIRSMWGFQERFWLMMTPRNFVLSKRDIEESLILITVLRSLEFIFFLFKSAVNILHNDAKHNKT